MLSEEAQIFIEFCKRSSIIRVNKITAGVSIHLGNLNPQTPNDDWILFPRMLCSPDCFKELCEAGLLIHIRERWLTHKEEAYIVKV